MGEDPLTDGCEGRHCGCVNSIDRYYGVSHFRLAHSRNIHSLQRHSASLSSVHYSFIFLSHCSNIVIPLRASSRFQILSTICKTSKFKCCDIHRCFVNGMKPSSNEICISPLTFWHLPVRSLSVMKQIISFQTQLHCFASTLLDFVCIVRRVKVSGVCSSIKLLNCYPI